MSNNLDLVILTELRKKGMTQKELARMLGISDVYLSDILKGRKNGPKAQLHIQKMCRVLGIKLSEIIVNGKG